VSENRKISYQNDPESRRRHDLWSRYRLRPEDLALLLENQGNMCALCPTTFVGRESYNIDRDHNTGEVRGILCSPCNIRLGWYENKSEKITKYLGL